MAADYLWLWDNVNSVWVKAQCDAAGKLLISDLDPFTVQQTTPMNLRHVPHGYYAVGTSYLPYAVDSAGKLLLSIAALQHLSDIADVNLTGLADGDFIYYDSGSATWKRIAHKDATTGVHGVGAGTVAKVTDIAVLANIPNLTSGKIWKGDVTDRPAEASEAGGGYTQGARVYHNANQAIPTATATKLAFNSERWDTDTIHDTVTNNSRLTCKTAGKYIIAASIKWGTNATGARYIALLLNNTDYIASGSQLPLATAGTDIYIATIESLAVNDYVEVSLYQTSGVSLNIEVAGAYSPDFMMARIG